MICPCFLADDPNSLRCGRTDPHQPHHGCTFVSTSGVINHAPREDALVLSGRRGRLS